MAKLSALRVSTDAESEGVELEYELGVKFKIARDTSPALMAACEKALDPHIDRVRSGLMTAEEEFAILAPARAEFLIRGWSGLTDEKDETKPFEYSKAAALEMILDRRYRDVVNWALLQSRKRSVFLERNQKAALGN